MGNPMPPPPSSDSSPDQAARTPPLPTLPGRRRNRIYPAPVYQNPSLATTANTEQQATPLLQQPKTSRFYQFGTFCAQSTNFLFTLPGRIKAHYDELKVAGEQNPTLDPHLQYPCSWPTDHNDMGNATRSLVSSSPVPPAPPAQKSEIPLSSGRPVEMPCADTEQPEAAAAGPSKKGIPNELQSHQTSGRNTVLGLVKKQRNLPSNGSTASQAKINTPDETTLNEASGFSKMNTSKGRSLSVASQLKALGSGNTVMQKTSQHASGPKSKEKDILMAPTPIPNTIPEAKQQLEASGSEVQQPSPSTSKSKPSTLQTFLNISNGVSPISTIISESIDLDHIDMKNSQTHDANTSIPSHKTSATGSGLGNKGHKLSQYDTRPDLQEKSGDCCKEKDAPIEKPATTTQVPELTNTAKADHRRDLQQKYGDEVASPSSISVQASDTLRRHPQNMAKLQKLDAEMRAKLAEQLDQTSSMNTAINSGSVLTDPVQVDYPPSRPIAQPHSRIAIARGNAIGNNKQGSLYTMDQNAPKSPIFTLPVFTPPSTIPGSKAFQNREWTPGNFFATPNPFAQHTATDHKNQQTMTMNTDTSLSWDQKSNSPVISSVMEKGQMTLNLPQKKHEDKTGHSPSAEQAANEDLPSAVLPIMEKDKPKTLFDPFKDFEQLANMTQKWDQLVEARAREGQEPLRQEDLRWVKLFQKLQEKPASETNVETDDKAFTVHMDESQEEIELEIEETNKSRKKKKKKKSKAKKCNPNTSAAVASETKVSGEPKVYNSNTGTMQPGRLATMTTKKGADTSFLENDWKTLPAPGGFWFPAPATQPISVQPSGSNSSNLAWTNPVSNGMTTPLEPVKTRIQTSGGRMGIGEKLPELSHQELQPRNQLHPKSLQHETGTDLIAQSSQVTSGPTTATGQPRTTIVTSENLPSYANSEEAAALTVHGDSQFPSSEIFSRLHREISKEQIKAIYFNQLRHLATWWNFKDDTDLHAFKSHVKKHISQYIFGRMQRIINEYTDQDFFSDDINKMLNEVVEQATEMRMAESDELVNYYLMNIIAKSPTKDDLSVCSSTDTPPDSPLLRENATAKQLSVPSVSGRKSAFQENLEKVKSVPKKEAAEAPRSYKSTQRYHDTKPDLTPVSRDKKQDWIKLLDEGELINLKTILNYQRSTTIELSTRSPKTPEGATLKGPFFLEEGKPEWHYELMYSTEYFRLLNTLHLQKCDSDDTDIRVRLGKRQRGIKDSGCGVLGCTGCRACPGPSGRRLHPRGQCIVVMTAGETVFVEAWVDKEKEVDLITFTPIDNVTFTALRKAGVHIKPWAYEDDGRTTAPLKTRLRNVARLNPAMYVPVTANTEEIDEGEDAYDEGECEPDDADSDVDIDDEDTCQYASPPNHHGLSARSVQGNYPDLSDSIIGNPARMQAEVSAFLIEERINELKKQKQLAVDENAWLIQERVNLLEKQQLLEKEMQRRAAEEKNLQQQQRQQQQRAQGKQRK